MRGNFTERNSNLRASNGEERMIITATLVKLSLLTLILIDARETRFIRRQITLNSGLASITERASEGVYFRHLLTRGFLPISPSGDSLFPFPAPSKEG